MCVLRRTKIRFHDFLLPFFVTILNFRCQFNCQQDCAYIDTSTVLHQDNYDQHNHQERE